MNIPTELVIAYTPLVVVMAGLGVLLVDNAASYLTEGHPEAQDEEEPAPGDTVPIPVRRQQ